MLLWSRITVAFDSFSGYLFMTYFWICRVSELRLFLNLFVGFGFDALLVVYGWIW